MNTKKLPSAPTRHRIHYKDASKRGDETHLKGTSSSSSATLTMLPYHGQMMKIWDEKEMKVMSVNVRPSLGVRAE